MYTYPVTRKEDLTETRFDIAIDDPYRWLEDDQSAETAQFVERQNAFTRAYLDRIPGREQVRERLTALHNYEKYMAFDLHEDTIIYQYNSGLQNQPVWYVQKGLDGESEILLDPNTLSEDGTVSVTLLSFSKNGKYLPYLISQSGSDWQTLRILDMDTKKPLPDALRWVKFTNAAWEGNGFYYSRYAAPDEGGELSARNEYQSVYYHELGADQAQDQLIYNDPGHPLRYYRPVTSKDEQDRIIHVSEGTYGNEVLWYDRDEGDYRSVFGGFHANRFFIGKYDGQLLFLTDEHAPKGKIAAFRPATMEITDLVPEGENGLKSARLSCEYLILEYLADVASRLILLNLKSGARREVALPGLGTVLQFAGSAELGGFLYSFGSFIEPLTLYFCDFEHGRSTVLKKSKLALDMSDFVMERHFVEASDGAKIPLFLSYRKGLKRDGKNSALLYAYGGFSISLPLSFSPQAAYLMERGCVYAQANIRGGNEYGDAWHRAGMLLNKQRVFDDFRECAEYLISHQYCSSETLAIEGRSNGGLLMGAVMNQHPELYRVVIPTVGVMDMLRYHLFTVGWGWIPEYGHPDEEAHFRNLLAYSPLHNIEEKPYPSVMIRTADHDDRVVPAHSFKFGATLQEKNRSEHPILLRIDRKAGHGVGKSLTKLIDEQADTYAFMFYELGLQD